MATSPSLSPEISFANFEEHKVTTDESLDKLARARGLTWQQLAQFNWGTAVPKQINECLHDLVGCRHKTKNGKNYIFTSKDDPGVIYLPVKSQHYKLATGKTHVIQVLRPHLKSDLEVETVDDFLQAMGNVNLLLQRQEGGPPVEITTDQNGYGTAKRILSGHYKITVKGGGPAYFLSRIDQPKNDDPNAEIGEFEEAVIDTRQKVEAITQLVVAKVATPTQKRERRLLQRVYTRTSTRKVKGRGTETDTRGSSGYTRLSPTCAIDDLALIAGWTNNDIDIANLTSSVLADFFEGRDGAPANRKYYVWLIEATGETPRVSVYNSSGQMEVSFKLTQSFSSGAFGAYTQYENRGGQLFVDMMTKSYSLSVKGKESEFVPLQELVSGADQQKLADAWNAHADRAEVPVVYFLPTLGQLAWIGMHGGSGRLQDYGTNQEINDRIHARNLKVCRRISFLYNGYIAGYIARVKQTRSEKELRKLGPPWAPYMMPTPGNATYQQVVDIFSAYDPHQLDAWKAICLHLDKLAGRKSEGFPYISLKAKYEIGGKEEGVEGEEALKKLAEGSKVGEPLPVSVEVEGSLTIQLTDDDIRVLTGREAKGKVSLEGEFKSKSGKYKLGLEYKRNLKKPEEWEVTIKTGPLELEANKDGTRKIALEALPEVWAESEFNPDEATFEGGLKIETGAMLEILEKLPVKNKSLQEFIEKYGKKVLPKEISVHAGMVGLREQTVLAVITNAPGFFDRRDLDELVELQWNALDLDEQIHLAQLGWNHCIWDLKSYKDAELPKTMEESWGDFTPEQQIALIHLGFYDVEDYHERIEHTRTAGTGWKDAIQKLKAACKGEGESSQAAGAE